MSDDTEPDDAEQQPMLTYDEILALRRAAFLAEQAPDPAYGVTHAPVLKLRGRKTTLPWELEHPPSYWVGNGIASNRVGGFLAVSPSHTTGHTPRTRRFPVGCSAA